MDILNWRRDHECVQGHLDFWENRTRGDTLFSVIAFFRIAKRALHMWWVPSLLAQVALEVIHTIAFIHKSINMNTKITNTVTVVSWFVWILLLTVTALFSQWPVSLWCWVSTWWRHGCLSWAWRWGRTSSRSSSRHWSRSHPTPKSSVLWSKLSKSGWKTILPWLPIR